jgi:hypothetical protein
MAERFDLDAIAADDALLDMLSAGGDSLFEAYDTHSDDAAVQLLAGLRLAVEDVDELAEPTVLADTDRFLSRVAARNPVSDPFARKMAARGLALSVAAVAALSVSGVAAAVTGDPLAPYEKVFERVVEVVRPQTTLPLQRLDGLVIGSKAEMVKAEKDLAARHHRNSETTGDERIGDKPVGESQFSDPLAIPQRTVARPPVVTEPTAPTKVTATQSSKEEPQPESTVKEEQVDTPTPPQQTLEPTEPQQSEPTTPTAPSETPTDTPTTTEPTTEPGNNGSTNEPPADGQASEPTGETQQSTEGQADTGGSDSTGGSADSQPGDQLGDQGTDSAAEGSGDQSGAGDRTGDQSADQQAEESAPQSQDTADEAEETDEAEAKPDIADPALLEAVTSDVLSGITGG